VESAIRDRPLYIVGDKLVIMGHSVLTLIGEIRSSLLFIVADM